MCWADLASGIVYSSKDGANGSLPRDVCDGDAQFAQRSALPRPAVSSVARSGGSGTAVDVAFEKKTSLFVVSAWNNSMAVTD